MDWIQTLSIIITVLGTGYYIHRDVKADMALQTSRIDTSNTRIDAANTRMDQMYSIIIDMLKEKK